MIYLKIFENISNMIKNKCNGELIYKENISKLKKNNKQKQKKGFNVYMHQQYWLIQFIEKMITIILKRFWKNFILLKTFVVTLIKNIMVKNV